MTWSGKGYRGTDRSGGEKGGRTAEGPNVKSEKSDKNSIKVYCLEQISMVSWSAMLNKPFVEHSGL